ncbi:hypothetical protein PVAND_007966 [Polypedilum vanderplanki]|uniref:Enhancer of polycomb-like protein n=1 Tax=Polypedilum vanderplanki TaxID=319348 RepID=A0A9J6C8L1_POLVA|nr:hypothetical protein PVAND_007966 [Polypedilum vanderplanki]
MSTKLSFRARALDPSKPMPIYYAEELPDLHEYSAINRAVPQMPSGMEKEEESEHHLQRAIIAGLIIPTPDVSCIKDDACYEKIYPADFKLPRQLIHVQPLSLEQDIPDYDMDSSDEIWVESKTDLTPYKFEQMMDRLEKITVCSLDDAKALVKRNEVNQDVFDYWVSKRLKTKHPLILSVKTDSRGNQTSNNPYIAFRRRTEKMQTRKNRKNDETSYEKMLKLRRDLSRAVKLLEMVKRREKMKKDDLQLNIEIYEKRYQAKDFSGQLMSEYSAVATKSRPAFAPLYSNQYYNHHSSSNLASQNNQWNSSSQSYANVHLNHHHLQNKRDFDGMSTSSSRKEKRQYKKRKHKTQREIIKQESYEGMFSSDDEDLSTQIGASESEDEGIYPFRRNRNCNYYKPFVDSFGNWPWESQENSGLTDPKYRYSLTSLCTPQPRCIGFARRRVGRGGRILLDRVSSNYDDIWSKLDFTIYDNEKSVATIEKFEQDTRIKDTCIINSNQPAINSLTDGTTAQVLTINSSGVKSQKSQNEHFNNNIVIKSENSKTIDTYDDQNSRVSQSDGINQKLDDFEQLLDSANASSNIINKNLVCKKSNDISSDVPHVRAIANSLSSSEIINKNVSVLNSYNSDTISSCVSSTNSSSSNNIAKIESDPQRHMSESSSLCEDRPSTTVSRVDTEEDVYKDLLDEIHNEWLHFQPLSPSMEMDDYVFESDFISDTRKFNIELQLLDDSKNETETTNCIDNTYLTQPMTLNCRNKSLEIHNNNLCESSNTTAANSDTVNMNIKTEPIERDFNETQTSTDDILNLNNEDESRYTADDDKFSSIMSSINYFDSSNNNQTGCSKFNLINEKFSMLDKELDALPLIDNNANSSSGITIKAENDLGNFSEQVIVSNNATSTVTTPIVIREPIAELQSHNYVLQYGSPSAAVTATVNTNNSSEIVNNSPKYVNATNSNNVIQQQFVNTGNTIISSPQQQKMQSIVYDNNTFVLATTARKQLNGPADRTLNQNQKFKQVFMLGLSQDKRKSIGTLNDANLIKKNYSDLTIGQQNILVSSLNSNLSANNITQSSNTQQFSLVHQKPIILGASTSTGAGTFMQSSAGNTTNKIIVTPASQLSGNIYMSTHGKLVIPSSNPQSIILDNAKMITTNQATTQPQEQQKLQSPNQQRVKMENKMNMLIESTGEKNIIYAKYNKNKIIQTNIIPMQAAAGANKNNVQAQNQQTVVTTAKQIATTQAQQQSINVISNNKSLQRIQAAPFTTQQTTQVLRPQFGTSSVNFQNASTPSKIIQQQSNNGSNIIGTVKSNDNSSTSPR